MHLVQGGDMDGEESEFERVSQAALRQKELSARALFYLPATDRMSWNIGLDQLRQLVADGWDVAHAREFWFEAAARSSVKTLEFMRDNGVDLVAARNEKKESLLHVAHHANVPWLAEMGVGLEARDRKGCTPLMSAALRALRSMQQDDLETLRQLARIGARIDGRDHEFYTPLARCICSSDGHWSRCREVAQTLLDCGADVHARLESGANLLVYAIHQPACLERAEFLLDSGARFDPGAGQVQRMAAQAISEERMDVLEKLAVHHGLPLDESPVQGGKSLADLAVERDSAVLLAYLLEHSEAAVQRLVHGRELLHPDAAWRSPRCQELFRSFLARRHADEALQESQVAKPTNI